RAGLGTINHSLLTLEAAKRAQLTLAAVVLNRPEDEKPSEYSIKLDADNRKIIGELGGVPVFEALPHIAGAGEMIDATHSLAEHLSQAGGDYLINSFFQ
ncbi:MAG: AAA family ATPase, partial [Gemmatimonadota bacterium]|nr:AAA family ATPase [Gemmatimonadota bacterium]